MQPAHYFLAGKAVTGVHSSDHGCKPVKRAGLVEIVQVRGKREKLLTRYRPTVRLHDLRHSYASHLVSNGVGLQIVGKLLGHVQASTTMRYAHLQDEALRAATDQLATIIEFKKGA